MTRDQIANRVLQSLGKLPVGQTPTSAMQNDILNAISSVEGRLRQDGLASWLPTEDIPDRFIDPFVALVASERGEGVPAQIYQRIMMRASQARKEIANQQNGPILNNRKYRDY